MNANQDVKFRPAGRHAAKQAVTGSIRICGALILGSFVALSTAPANDNAPPAYLASPDVYRVLDENDRFRVIEAVWQPGQEDNFHSHPADRVSLYRTDCRLQLTNADGGSRIGQPKAGTAKARSGSPVKAHKAKNIGDQVCIIQIVEMK